MKIPIVLQHKVTGYTKIGELNVDENGKIEGNIDDFYGQMINKNGHQKFAVEIYPIPDHPAT
jgi:hypothetical protein